MTTLDLNSMTPDQILELSKQVATKARSIKSEQKRKKKFAAFEPHYSEYRQSVLAAKAANDKKKSLFVQLKALGYGKRPAKSTPTKVTGRKK